MLEAALLLAEAWRYGGVRMGCYTRHNEGEETPLPELAAPILGRMNENAQRLDNLNKSPVHMQVVDQAKACVEDPSRTPSARLLQEIGHPGQSFWKLALRYSKKWHARHVDVTIPEKELVEMKLEAAQSLQRQKEVEDADVVSFEDYLKDFYKQY